MKKPKSLPFYQFLFVLLLVVLLLSLVPPQKPLQQRSQAETLRSQADDALLVTIVPTFF